MATPAPAQEETPLPHMEALPRTSVSAGDTEGQPQSATRASASPSTTEIQIRGFVADLESMIMPLEQVLMRIGSERFDIRLLRGRVDDEVRAAITDRMIHDVYWPAFDTSAREPTTRQTVHVSLVRNINASLQLHEPPEEDDRARGIEPIRLSEKTLAFLEQLKEENSSSKPGAQVRELVTARHAQPLEISISASQWSATEWRDRIMTMAFVESAERSSS